MTSLLLQPQTKQSIELFIRKPSHALILIGKAGAGKTTAAYLIASQLLNVDLSDIQKSSSIRIIEPEKNVIPIEAIRQVQEFFKLKTVGKQPIRRVLIIESAESMTIEAQNAFLKLLEEPPSDSVLLILTNQASKLLPTIRSRAQTLQINPSNRLELEKYFTKQGFDANSVRTAYYAGNGQVGAMSTILNKVDDNDYLQSLENAKKFLGMDAYQRLTNIDSLAKDKDVTASLVKSLVLVCRAALQQTADQQNFKAAKRWHHSLKFALETEAKLPANPNTKLLLTDLLLNL